MLIYCTNLDNDWILTLCTYLFLKAMYEIALNCRQFKTKYSKAVALKKILLDWKWINKS